MVYIVYMYLGVEISCNELGKSEAEGLQFF